jgi:hypothetical protein
MSRNLSRRTSRASGSAVGAAALLTAFLAGCSAGAVGAPETTGPAIDANAIAARALEANTIPRTSRLRFGWTLREPNLNVSGEGVVRVQPPDRARLDLFMGGDASVFAVVLVSDELRLPPGAPRQIVPSSPLLWAAFGIFRPGDDSTLLGGESVSDGVVRLRYLLADGHELHYRVRDGRVIGVEMLEDGDVLHRVDLRVDDADELPQQATYRNIAAFRELKVTVASIEDVDSYPDRIWRPGR